MSDVIQIKRVSLKFKDAEKCPKDGFPFTVKMGLICKDFDGDVFYCVFCNSPFYADGNQYVEFVTGEYRDLFLSLMRRVLVASGTEGRN